MPPDLRKSGVGRETDNVLPESVPGLDVQQWFSRMEDIGTVELYSEILMRFRKNFSEMPDRFVALADSGDHEAARRLVHTLKGASGTICANELYESARELEHAIRDSLAGAGERLEGIRALLAEVLGSIDLICDAAPSRDITKIRPGTRRQ